MNKAQQQEVASLEEVPPDTVRLNRLVVVGGLVGTGVLLIGLVLFTTGGSDGGSSPQTPQPRPAWELSGREQTFLDRPLAHGLDSSKQPAQIVPDPSFAEGLLSSAPAGGPAASERPSPRPRPSPKERAFQAALASGLRAGTSSPRPPGLAAGQKTSSRERYLQRQLETYANRFGEGPGGQTPGQGAPPGRRPSGASSRAFMDQAAQRQQRPVVAARVQAPRSPYEIKAGSVLPAALMSTINSQLPGEVVAQVSRDVYDSQRQQHLLIPKGSRLLGTYNDQVALGQKRALVAWTRLVFPDGRSVQLPGFGGQDLTGASGLKDKVNNHYWRVFGSAALLSAVGAGFQLSQPRSGRGFYGRGYLPPGQVVAGELGRELSRVATELIRRDMQARPTLEIRKGYRFYVFVNQDLALPGPYQEEPLPARFRAVPGVEALEVRR